MICNDGNGFVTAQNTSFNIEFVTSNGPKQMLWIQCAQVLMSYKHHDYVKMAMTIIAQNTIVCNFKRAKPK